MTRDRDRQRGPGLVAVTAAQLAEAEGRYPRGPGVRGFRCPRRSSVRGARVSKAEGQPLPPATHMPATVVAHIDASQGGGGRCQPSAGGWVPEVADRRPLRTIARGYGDFPAAT